MRFRCWSLIGQNKFTLQTSADGKVTPGSCTVQYKQLITCIMTGLRIICCARPSLTGVGHKLAYWHFPNNPNGKKLDLRNTNCQDSALIRICWQLLNNSILHVCILTLYFHLTIHYLPLHKYKRERQPRMNVIYYLNIAQNFQITIQNCVDVLWRVRNKSRMVVKGGSQKHFCWVK